MSKKVSGVLLITLLCISAAFSAAKFPFPQQATYANGILPEGISPGHVQRVYDIWVNGYYEENGNLARIKFDNPSQSVSEGIAYGMLIMVYMDNAQNNTQPKFDKLWNYWKQYSSGGSLMDWKINGFGGVAEGGSATDGDIDAGLALALAAEQWGDSKYLDGARTIMGGIRSADVSGNLLDGGSNWDAINPSYMSMVATEIFNKVDAGGGWSSIQSSCYSHLKSSQNGQTGMWPNWTSGSPPGYNCPGCYGFDAARIPWRLGWAYVWFGHADAKSCCTKIVDWFKQHTGDNPGTIGQIYNLDGSINASGSSDNIPTYLGPLVVAGMVDQQYQDWVDKGYTRLRSFGANDDNYYNECLELLTMLLLSGNMPDLTTAQPKSSAKLTVNVEPPEAGTVKISDQRDSYPLGTSVSVSVTSNDEEQYRFVGWSGDITDKNTDVTLTLSYDVNITAVFKDMKAWDMVDDCEGKTSKTFLGTYWFTYNDGEVGGSSTIIPLSADTTFYKTEGGYESDKALRIEYKIGGATQYGDGFVGMGFTMPKAEKDISEAKSIRFYYKGNFPDGAVSLKVETETVSEEGAYHAFILPASSDWTEININWDDFLQPSWTKEPKPLDLTTVTKFQWQVEGNGLSGDFWIDEIHLVGYYIEPPQRLPLITPVGKQGGQSPVLSLAGNNARCVTTCDGMVDLVLFDLCGRKVCNLMSGYLGAGTYSVQLQTAETARSNNSYILRLTTENGVCTRQVFVSK
jgi:endo-1,4-beta-D-glucanase Y